jgi:hypothetical protein
MLPIPLVYFNLLDVSKYSSNLDPSEDYKVWSLVLSRPFTHRVREPLISYNANLRIPQCLSNFAGACCTFRNDHMGNFSRYPITMSASKEP